MTPRVQDLVKKSPEKFDTTRADPQTAAETSVRPLEQAAAAAMVAEAKVRGLELTGPNGLLKLFT